MKVLSMQEVNSVSGAGNVEICQAGTTVAGAVIGGVAGTLFCPVSF